MILVDTSVWIDHLRSGNDRLAAALDEGRVLGHPWVTGELALGHLVHRDEILSLLRNLPAAEVAADDEVLDVIERHDLAGSGVGYVDAQLLASTLLTPDAILWSEDQRLTAAASRLGRAVGQR